MSDESNTKIDDCLLISRAAQLLERTGLAMTGAMIGTFVAAQLARTSVALFQTFGFIVLTVLSGMIGFYLRVNVPRLPGTIRGRQSNVVRAGWLSAAGTFLSALAALVSVYALVFDEPLQRFWEFVIGSWWGIGVILQTSAGLIGSGWSSKPSMRGRDELLKPPSAPMLH
jgi:hypothetical protein